MNTMPNEKKDSSFYIKRVLAATIAALAFFNLMMYFYTHLQLWLIVSLPLSFFISAVIFEGSLFLVEEFFSKKYFPIALTFIVLSLSICTYFMYEYTENLKIEIATKNEIERIERVAKYKSKEYANKDCDKQGAQEAIDLIVNGGLVERQNNPDSVIVWYIWKDDWYGFTKEQRYQLTSGIGGAEKCLTGKAIRIRVGNRDVAKSTLTGNVELMD